MACCIVAVLLISPKIIYFWRMKLLKELNKDLNIENCGPILTVSEAAKVLKVSDTTVYSLIRAEKLHAVKITSKLYRISRESVKEFLCIA